MQALLLIGVLEQLFVADQQLPADKIRKGGQGAVTRCGDMAVKCIDYANRKDVAKAIVDIEREYNSLKTLVHPSIVRFLDFEHNAAAKRAFIRMEWAATKLSVSDDAVDLADLIHQRCDEQRYRRSCGASYLSAIHKRAY